MLPAFAALSLLLIAACSEADDPAGESPAIVKDSSESEQVLQAPEQAGSAAIPGALQGKWALTRSDCNPAATGAQGLLTVSSDTVRFYESIGKVGPVKQADADSIRAEFAFSGEGQTWTRDMELSLSENGNSLMRSEFGKDSPAKPLTYTKCT